MAGVFTKQVNLSRRMLLGLGVLVVGVGILAWRLSDPTERVKNELEVDGKVIKIHKPIPVAANRSAEVGDGFRGAVHPLLHGQTRLEVTAHWTPIERRRLNFDVPDAVFPWYT